MKYTTPEIEMVEFGVVDVITASFGEDNDSTTTPPNPTDPDALPVG